MPQERHIDHIVTYEVNNGQLELPIHIKHAFNKSKCTYKNYYLKQKSKGVKVAWHVYDYRGSWAIGVFLKGVVLPTEEILVQHGFEYEAARKVWMTPRGY